MKKFFTLAAAALMSIGMWAAYPTATTTYALEDLTVTEATLTYEKTGLSGDAQKLNKVLYVQVEVPCASANGNLYLRGTSSNTNRFATIWGSNGTERDEARKVAMKNGNSDAIPFTEADILEDGGKYYIRFSSADNDGSYFDYKISGFSYVLNEECVTKEIDHVVEALTGAAINGVALGETEMTTLLIGGAFEAPTEYVEAPTVTFTVQTNTYYVGEETPSTKSKDIDVVAVLNPDGKWQAQQTVGEQTYTITAVKPATATITYMDGETILGEEIVKVGESATKYGEYEVKPLAEFQGWYSDAELTSEADLSATVGEDMVLYAKFDKAYAQSIDFEGMVINNGKSYDVKSALTANFYDYKDINALDSLNNEKGAARNEPYLGLKIKKQGGYLACNVQPGTTIRIKFGYVAETVLAIAGGDTLPLNPTDNKIADLEFPIMVETLVKLQTTSDKTVVIKQIMIDEPIVTWMYPINYAETENGKVEGWTIAFPNEEVTITATPEEGYNVADVKVNGTPLNPVEGVYKFNMLSEPVTVSASFEEGEPVIVTNYNITIAEGIVNGTVGANYATAEAGDVITLTIEPAEGYKVEAVKYNDGEDHVIEAVEGAYTFIMPAANVTVSATFVEDGEPIVPQPEIYTITVTAGEHGTASAPVSESRADERIELTIEPDEGYRVDEVRVNGTGLMPENGVYSFTMPAANVTVVVTFEQAQGIDEINAAAKAVKRLENGMLIIEKNGVLYNVQGIRVK